MEIIDKKEFAIVILNKDNKTFVVHMAAVSIVDLNVHLSWHIQIALPKVKKVTIPSKYTDYINVFFPNFTAKLPKHTGIINHFIDLIDNKQPLYGLIYSLGLMELDILKTYIKTNLVNGFIRLFKSLANISILFVYKKDGSFWLCVD